MKGLRVFLKKSQQPLLAFALLCLIAAAWATQQPMLTPKTPTAVLLDVKGLIGPAMQDYLERGFVTAHKQNAQLIILRMDTPGGLDSSMRAIIQSILDSPIPIATYVTPSGARAASAGTYILYASHIAAMTPSTNLGAATPVSLGMPGAPSPDNPKKTAKEHTSKTPMERKIINDATAYIRGLAKLNGRNAKWAEKAVRQAASLSAGDALKNHVIDLIAKDVPHLLTQLHGRKIKVQHNTITLKTDGLTIHAIKPDWRTKFLTTITNPNIAYILMLLGIYGIIFELSNPGFILPGVTGVIALLIAAYAFQMLPINYTGLALIVSGLAFMITEAFVSSFGALGIGGLIAFVIGSIMLMDTTAPGFTVHLPTIITISMMTGLFITLVMNMVLRARFRKVVSGQETLIGKKGQIQVDNHGILYIRLEGELWQIQSDEVLQEHDPVVVVSCEGLKLIVRSKS